MNQWHAAGYDYYPLSNAQSYIPSDVYNSFVSTAEREANPDFDYMDYSLKTRFYVWLPDFRYYEHFFQGTWMGLRRI